MGQSMGTAMIVRTTADPASMTGAVREAARALDPDQPLFAVQPLDVVLAENRWPYRVFGSLFVIFAVIALVLSSVGIYAITSYSVSQRTAELGLRLALGAQGSQISWLILRTGLIQLGLGLALGLGAAWGVSQILKTIVAQIPAVDPVTFVGITVLLTIVMLTACLIPARRATRMDPLAALRVE
jgi:putative ABC transport system permease protein